MSGGGGWGDAEADGKGERISQADSSLNSKPDMELSLTILRLGPEPKSSWTLHQWSHPGVPAKMGLFTYP